jgi:Holliday junction resolvase
MRGLEGKIQKDISDYLSNKGYFVINLIKTNKNGIPDLIALKKDHKPLFIEVKTKRGKLSTLQKWYISHLNNMGFLAIVAKSLDDVLTRIT